MENNIIDFKIQDDNTNMVISVIGDTTHSNKLYKDIDNDILAIENEIEWNQKRIDSLNEEINRLTNHSDALDYIVAVGSGVLTGLLDSFFVGEFLLLEGKKWGSEKVNDFICSFAKSNGYKGKGGDSLGNAISFLERKFGLASDSLTSEFGGSLQHHLRDFSHHPSLVGWFFSMFTQYTGKVIGTSTSGSPIIVELKDRSLIGKTHKEKFILGTINWIGHLISDMAGSSNTPGAGKGIPGPICSVIKELSALLHPLVKKNEAGNNELSVWVSKLFNGTLLGERDSTGKLINGCGFDLRAEIGCGFEIGKQSIPVILNEVIVKCFYFVRRLIKELHEHPIHSFSDLSKISWKSVLPYNNRTITRMMTIASGTFVAVDVTDAAIRSSLKSGGNATVFVSNFILRVNFVGIGRFAVAIYTDAKMGIQKRKKEYEKMALYSQQIELKNAKVFYKQSQMWIVAKDTSAAVNKLYNNAMKSIPYIYEVWDSNCLDICSISKNKNGIEIHNPGLLEEITKKII